MSNHFDVKCTACDAYAGLRINWGGDAIANALHHRPAIEAFGRVLSALQRSWELGDAQGLIVAMAHFLAAHAGHELVVIDEYGAIHGTCAADVVCTCGARHKCRLPKGHEGFHAQ